MNEGLRLLGVGAVEHLREYVSGSVENRREFDTDMLDLQRRHERMQQRDERWVASILKAWEVK